MTMRILLLAVSYKHGGYCVAGINLANEKFVRLVTDDQTHCGPLDSSLFPFSPFDIIDVCIREKAPTNGAQTENYFINNYNIKRVGFDNSRETLIKYLDKHHITPFGTRYSSLNVSKYNELDYSLCLLRVSEIILYNEINNDGTAKTKVNFITTMNNGLTIQHNSYSVTDPIIVRRMHGINEAVFLGHGYLLISIGPTQEEHYRYQYKFVSNIILDEDLS